MGALPVLLTWFWISLLLVSDVQGDTRPLVRELLKRNPDKVRPVINESTAVGVKFEIVPRRILYLSEIHQELKLFCWLRMEWKDEFLQWDPADYNGTDKVFISKEDTWYPDIVLYQSNAPPSTPADYVPFVVSSDGTVYALMPQIYTANCRMNLTLYPFDTQECVLKFGSWAHNGNLINISALVEKGETETYLQNGEWDLESLEIVNNIMYYSCCPEPYFDVDYTIRLVRAPLFYILNLMIPFLVLSLLSAAVFITPPESGEKVSLAVTTLLSLVVFTQLVLTIIPAASDGTQPIIGLYFVGSVVGVSIVVILSVLSLHAFNSKDSGRPVPRYLRFIVLTCMGTICYKLHVLRKPPNKEKRQPRFSCYGYSSRSKSQNPQSDCTILDNQHATGANNGNIFTLPDTATFPRDGEPGNTADTTNGVPRGSVRVPGTMDDGMMHGRGYGKAAVNLAGQGDGEMTNMAMDWVEVSRVMDRFFLISFALILCGIAIANIIQHL